jgi:hypothetical protein
MRVRRCCAIQSSLARASNALESTSSLHTAIAIVAMVDMVPHHAYGSPSAFAGGRPEVKRTG